MKRRILPLMVTLCLCSGLAACSQNHSTAPTTPPASKAADTGKETNEQALSEDTGKEPVEQALSGKVTVYMPSPAGLADKLAAAFTEKTGVQVEQFQGTTGEILARLEAEQALSLIHI